MAVIIADWDEAGVKPPIFAVEAFQARFVMEGNTGGYRFLKNLKDTGKILRMYDINCSPILQLFRRPAKILDHLAIDGFEFTIRGRDRNRTGYPIDCRTQTSFAFAQCVFRALAVVDVNEEVVPPDYTTVRIPERRSAILKPAVDAIEASSPKFDLKGLARRDR